MTIEEIYGRFLECGGITTDSRRCGRGLMFFALKGERFDGNRFVTDALEQGCSYAVMDDETRYNPADGRMILVTDVLKVLQVLAAFHRRCMGTPVIGITGTNGKTTTKELLSAVMQTTYNILCTQGNLNNQIGVPITLLALRPEHEYAIVEMGASKPGDIRELVEISRPDYGLITNVGRAHLLGFGSLEGVMRTKGELYDWLREHGGTAFVNRDDECLHAMAVGLPKIEYGRSGQYGLPAEVEYGRPGRTGLLVEGEVLECNPYVRFRWRSGKGEWHTVQTRLIGAYNIDNALAAITVGLHFGVSEEAISDAITNYTPSNSRSQLIKTARNSLVVDSYNANPTSMRAVLDNFRMIEADRKMLILGDMRELGEVSEKEHRVIVELIGRYGFTNVWLVGEEFSKAAAGTDFRLFANVDDVRAELESNPVEGETILIKGSNSMNMIKVKDFL